MKSVGLEPRVLAKSSIELRPLFDLHWLEQLGGTSHGLYMIRDGKAYKHIYAVEACFQSFIVLGSPRASNALVAIRSVEHSIRRIKVRAARTG